MNKLFVTGNLVRDPESSTTQDGKTVCNFTIACNRRQKDKDGKNVADFFRVSAWNALGENCQKYLAKGRKVAVVGAVSVHAYSAQDGTAKGSLEVLAQDVEFLSSANSGEQAQESAPEVQPNLTPVEPSDLPF